jgi:hypothetical protein
MGKQLTTEQREQVNQNSKRWRAAKKKDAAFIAQERTRFADFRAANRQRIRSNQNAKNARNIARAPRRAASAIAEMSAAGIHHITTDQLRHDRTRWTGPGQRHELELEALADALLGLQNYRKWKKAHPEQARAETAERRKEAAQ